MISLDSPSQMKTLRVSCLALADMYFHIQLTHVRCHIINFLLHTSRKL